MERLQERAEAEVAERLGVSELEGRSLQSTLGRGWYCGVQNFREALMDPFQDVGRKARANRNARSSPEAKDFGQRHAEEILKLGMKALDLSEEQIAKPGLGDLRRAAIGWMIWTSTAGVPQNWIAKKLNLKSAANASQQVRRFASLEARERPRKIREWVAKRCNMLTESICIWSAQ